MIFVRDISIDKLESHTMSHTRSQQDEHAIISDNLTKTRHSLR